MRCLAEPQYKEYIAWSADGFCLEVINQRDFSRDILPQLFKTNQFSSFVRQLHLYRFQKHGEVIPEQPLYYHAQFRRVRSRRTREIATRL
jgi:hypothetical protein